MRVQTPEISWHGRDPVYSVDFQPGKHIVKRLATCGVDKYIRIWEVCQPDSSDSEVKILSNLNRHEKSVNVVRFSPDGTILASAGDDCIVFLWQLCEESNAPSLFKEEEDENREHWNVIKTLRGHLEDIYDLCWSADGHRIITGAVDNTAIIWDIQKECKVALLNDHKSFVQGVAYDPLLKYVATLSTDRSCRIFLTTGKVTNNISRLQLPNSAQTDDTNQTESKQKWCRMYHDDSMRSFFRRLSFSPDGEILATPAGCIEESDRVMSTCYLFSRHNFAKPVLHLPSRQKVTIAVRFSPVLYELTKKEKILSPDIDPANLKSWEKYDTIFCLPYRMIFAVATEDSIVLYDTQQRFPFAHVSKIHYHQLSDLTWSSDGLSLAVASTDGYVSIVQFEPNELGTVYQDQIVPSTKLCFSDAPDSNTSISRLPVIENTDHGKSKTEARISLNLDNVNNRKNDKKIAIPFSDLGSVSHTVMEVDSNLDDDAQEKSIKNVPFGSCNMDKSDAKIENSKNFKNKENLYDSSYKSETLLISEDSIGFKTNVVELESKNDQPVSKVEPTAPVQPKRRIQLITLSSK